MSAPSPQQYTFEQMNLQVGMRVQCITHRGLKPIQHFSTVVGWVRDEYLIVKVPVEHGAPITMREGEKLTLRVFSGVNVCSFSSGGAGGVGRPLHYAIATSPPDLQGTNLRTAMRVKVDIPAQIKGPAGAEQVGFLVNLSVSGALLETRRPVPADTNTIQLQFTLLTEPDKRQVIISAEASIRNVTSPEAAAGAAPKFSYGLQFIDLEPAQFVMLQNLTYQALIAAQQKIV
jgi:c-di-GMP-binding flagellar brake protein YcgR